MWSPCAEREREREREREKERKRERERPIVCAERWLNDLTKVAQYKAFILCCYEPPSSSSVTTADDDGGGGGDGGAGDLFSVVCSLTVTTVENNKQRREKGEQWTVNRRKTYVFCPLSIPVFLSLPPTHSHTQWSWKGGSFLGLDCSLHWAPASTTSAAAAVSALAAASVLGTHTHTHYCLTALSFTGAGHHREQW